MVPAKDDWVSQALLARARNNEATIRERGTAAMGLWQRALAEGRRVPEADQGEPAGPDHRIQGPRIPARCPGRAAVARGNARTRYRQTGRSLQ